jgi:AcrR family transcriptional regulator
MDEKHNQIIEETAKLFFKYGIRSVTMDDVAKEIGISKKTLYQHFTDKTNLVDSVIEYLGEKTDLSHCGEEKDLNPIEKHYFIYKKITKLLVERNASFEYDLQKYYPEQFKKMLSFRRDSMFKKMKNDLIQGIKEGFFRDNMDVDKVVVLNMIRVESMNDNAVLKKYNYEMLDVLDEFFKYHLYAIATQKGINEYQKLINNDNNE